jgi:hypothetical protein
MVCMTQTKRVEILSVAFPSISRSINQASDALTENIVQLEDALSKFRLGVRAEIVLNSEQVEGSDEPMTYIESLEYSKHNGKWGLWLAEYYDESVDANDPNSYNITPLKDASRELRFQAVDKFPELLQLLAVKGKEFADEAARKSERVAQIVSMLKSIDLLNI